MAHIGTAIKTGKTEVPTEQTAVKLITEPTQNVTLQVWVMADPSNVGALAAIGDKNVNAKKTLGTFRGIPLEKKQLPIAIEIDDPQKLWVDVEKGKDVITWTLIEA